MLNLRLNERNLTCKHSLSGHVASPATSNESKLSNKIINIVIITIINQLIGAHRVILIQKKSNLHKLAPNNKSN